ncbi:hypothetical protein [Seonamhaeicola marinus]|uniref:hypothetical protein n=1 Tax=Seonamhaeicola marinus TaxID=1912246 RepID=UPI001CA325AF|nr:hypothetical protein [Seonamhaeicola marinus]
MSDKVGAKERNFTSQPTSQCCYKTTRTNDKATSILLEYQDTTIIKSFDYLNLYSKHYDRNIGILLFFTNATVSIYGEHLDKLFLELNDSMVTSIQEYIGKPVANDEVINADVAIVNSIEVKYKDTELLNDISEFESKGFQQGYDETG